jgi:hypothetical protein
VVEKLQQVPVRYCATGGKWNGALNTAGDAGLPTFDMSKRSVVSAFSSASRFCFWRSRIASVSSSPAFARASSASSISLITGSRYLG